MTIWHWRIHLHCINVCYNCSYQLITQLILLLNFFQTDVTCISSQIRKKSQNYHPIRNFLCWKEVFFLPLDLLPLLTNFLVRGLLCSKILLLFKQFQMFCPRKHACIRARPSLATQTIFLKSSSIILKHDRIIVQCALCNKYFAYTIAIVWWAKMFVNVFTYEIHSSNVDENHF